MDYIFLECKLKEDCPFDQCCYDQKCVECPIPGCIINVMIGRFNFNIFFSECTSNNDCPLDQCCNDNKCGKCKGMKV